MRSPACFRLHFLSRTEHFHPPLAAEDRLQQLFEPLLVSLGRKSVDFVQVGVGAWDLDMFRVSLFHLTLFLLHRFAFV
jgi:hypothetical protein